MPHQEFFATNRVLLLTFRGKLDLNTFSNVVPEMPPEGARGYDALIDLSEVENIEGGFTQISTLVSGKEARYRHMAAPTRLAFWAPGDLAFGTCRMFEQIAHDRLPPDISVTRDIREAIAHIGRAEHNLAALRAALQDTEQTPARKVRYPSLLMA